MTYPVKILWGVLLVSLAVLAVVSNIVRVPLNGYRHIEHTTNAGELTQEVLVGQTFTADRDYLSGIGVLFATYSERNNVGTVELHVKESIYSAQDIRVASVAPEKLHDNQTYTFSFDPIQDSAGKQYFFYVVAPTAQEGQAVTVDIDTRDPYHLGSAYVVRGQGANVTDGAVLERSGKPTQDVGFTLQYSVLARQAFTQQTTAFIRNVIGGWAENRGAYITWMRSFALGMTVLFAIVLVQPRVYEWVISRVSKKTFAVFGVTVAVIIGITIRLIYANSLPITNDEGNYLYDAFSIRQGVFAGGDGYVKAPLVIAWVALWQTIVGNTVLAGRLASVLVGALTAVPLYFIAKHMWTSQKGGAAWLPDADKDGYESFIAGWGRRIGVLAALIWACSGSAIVSNIYVHTQPVALFVATSGLALLIASLRGNVQTRTLRIFLAGMLVGLGVASRKSILALGLIPLVFFIADTHPRKDKFKHLLVFGLGFLLTITLFLSAAFYYYGQQGVFEAIGYNSAEDGVTANAGEDPEQIRAYSLRGMTPFFRESLPLILLSTLGLGFAFEYFVLAILGKATSSRAVLWMSRIGWVVAWGVFLWARGFFLEYEGEAFMRWGISFLWWVFGFMLAVGTLWPSGVSPDTGTVSIPRRLIAAITIPLWVGGLVIFYMNWIKFHANYISEFIPPLTLLSAFGAVALVRRLKANISQSPWVPVVQNMLLGVFGVALVWSATVSNFITYVYEHTGTFQQDAVAEAAAWAKTNIPQNERIFTGAAVVPYVSGHRISLDIAHPRWYAYEFTRTDTKRLNTFLKSIEEMLQAYREANWFLLDQQTGFSFLMEYSEIEAGLATDWEQIKEVENGGNTLTFFRRK